MFAGNCFAASAAVERIIPSKKVLLHKDGKKVGEYTAEAPLPENTMLQCQGDCAVKLNDLYVIALDKSVFQVNSTDEGRRLVVQEGTAHFALSNLDRSMTFTTPVGTVSTQQLNLQAASTSMLKGYLAVTPQSVELGVTEGGSITVLTATGAQTVEAGNRLLLAQAQPTTAATGTNGWCCAENEDGALEVFAATVPVCEEREGEFYETEEAAKADCLPKAAAWWATGTAIGLAAALAVVGGVTLLTGDSDTSGQTFIPEGSPFRP
jgi:hypothetical protein